MIERPVIGSTTLLTIVISMKRTQITPLLLLQYSCVEFSALFIELIFKIIKRPFHDESFKKTKVDQTFSFEKIS